MIPPICIDHPYICLSLMILHDNPALVVALVIGLALGSTFLLDYIISRGKK